MKKNRLRDKVSDVPYEAGCDEAGRGCLAGPVFAAAVILPPEFQHPELNDSKQLTAAQRERLANYIKENACTWAVAFVDEQTIDKINILNASILAMHKALSQLSPAPQFIAVDGNRFKSWNRIPYSCEVKGDARFIHIAAASILAKTERDRYMNLLHQEFPDYGWNQNKGYATEQHRKIILQKGYTKYHRKSFVIKDFQQKLFEE